MKPAIYSLLFVMASSIAMAGELRGQVIGVVDGDTLDVLSVENSKSVRIRLNGINTPERTEPFYQKAKASLSELAYGQTAHVETVGKDTHGRTVGVVYVGNLNVNLVQVERGYAMVCKNYTKDEALWDAEERAMAKRFNIWAPPGPNRPAWCKG